MEPPRPRKPGKRDAGIRFLSFSENSGDLERAQQRAADWMNDCQALDLITINTSMTEHKATVTVWYRVKTKQAAP